LRPFVVQYGLDITCLHSIAALTCQNKLVKPM